MESDLVLDWLDSLGGAKLVEHTFCVFSKELETESLADLRQRISDNLPSLQSELDQQAELNRAFISDRPSYHNRSLPGQSRPPRRRPPGAPTPPQRPSFSSPSSQSKPPCKLCLATNPKIAHTHGIATCYQLTNTDKKHVNRAVLTDDDYLNDSFDYQQNDYLE